MDPLYEIAIECRDFGGDLRYRPMIYTMRPPYIEEIQAAKGERVQHQRQKLLHSGSFVSDFDVANAYAKGWLISYRTSHPNGG